MGIRWSFNAVPKYWKLLTPIPASTFWKKYFFWYFIHNFFCSIQENVDKFRFKFCSSGFKRCSGLLYSIPTTLLFTFSSFKFSNTGKSKKKLSLFSRHLKIAFRIPFQSFFFSLFNPFFKHRRFFAFPSDLMALLRRKK